MDGTTTPTSVKTTDSFRRAILASLFIIPIALCTGCGVDFAYLLPAAVGQFELLNASVSVEEALASGQLTEEQIDKLTLIREAREYSRDTMGLKVGDNYTTFYNSYGEPVAYNVSASRKDVFAPKTWTFPIVGTVPYLGYFDLNQAEAKKNSLVAENYDVMMYPIDAYSGIGYFPNPILSPMLERSDLDLIDTTIHELLHNTIWRVNDTTFNESLATFFGRRGTLSFLAEKYPDQPELLESAVDRVEDIDRYNAFALELYNELNDFYNSALSSETKIEGREAIFQAGRERFEEEVLPLMNVPTNYEWVTRLPSNNAWMLGIRRYNLEIDVFDNVYEATGQDWQTSLEVFRQAAKASDPYQMLKDWIKEN